MALTAKQERFVEEYMVDLNATQAAIRAGYSKDTARAIACENLTKPHIESAVAEAMKKLSDRTGISQERVLAELAKIGFSDIRKAIKWSGNLVTEEDNPDGGDVLVIKTMISNSVELIDSDLLDDATAGAIAQISQNAAGGISLKMYDKQTALVNLGKHLGMFSDKVEVRGPGPNGEHMVNDMTTLELARQIAFTLTKAAEDKT